MCNCPGVGYIGSCIINNSNAQIEWNCVNNSPDTLLMASGPGLAFVIPVFFLPFLLSFMGNENIEDAYSSFLLRWMEHCNLRGGFFWGYWCVRLCEHSLRDVLHTVSVWIEDQCVTFHFHFISKHGMGLTPNLSSAVWCRSECWDYAFFTVTFAPIFWFWVCVTLFAFKFHLERGVHFLWHKGTILFSLNPPSPLLSRRPSVKVTEIFSKVWNIYFTTLDGQMSAIFLAKNKRILLSEGFYQRIEGFRSVYSHILSSSHTKKSKYRTDLLLELL